MGNDVFISYSRKDAPFVLQLTADLESHGVNVWIDQGGIIAGDVWRRQIVDAISDCRVFLLILSPNSTTSENVVKELSIAESTRKRIVPVLFQPVEIPREMTYQLAGVQYQSFETGDYAANFERLLQALARLGIEIHAETIKPIPLPPELTSAIESPISSVRLGAIRELTRLLNGGIAGLALSAHERLKQLADDDSRSVSTAATAALQEYQANAQARPEQAAQEQQAREKAEQERLTRQKAEQARLVREEAEQKKFAREKVEQERLAREKAGRERLASEKAQQEKLVHEKAEQERPTRAQTMGESPSPFSQPGISISDKKALPRSRSNWIGLGALGVFGVLVVLVCFAFVFMSILPQALARTPSPTAAPPTAARASSSSASVFSSTAVSSSSVASSSSIATKFSCTDRLGCIDISPNDPIHIAYALVTSGDNSALGLDSKYGAEIAIDDAGGKVLGHVIKFDGQDTGCSSEGGQAAATKLAADKTIVSIIGTSCSSEARASMPILLTQAGLSMISPSNTAPDLTDPTKHVAGYFRTSLSDKVQGVVVADFVAKQLRLMKAATINDGSIYAIGLSGAFIDQFKKNGGTITSQDAVTVGDKDMKPVLTRIAAGKPDLIYFPIFTSEAGYIASQVRDVPGLERVVLMGSDGIFSPDFLKAGGKNTIGMYLSSPNFSAFGSGYSKLVDTYLKKYNVKGVLASFHAHAYDAINVLLAALQKPNVVVKDADGTLHLQKQALRDALASTDMQGITGHIKCDANGDCADPKIAIYQVTSDNYNRNTVPTTPIWSP